MKLTLTRDTLADDFTLGKLTAGNVCFYTCEDAVRDEKVYGKTAIPAGVYQVELTFSQRFQKILPLLKDVPNFSGVRIHSGNTAADTEGCILIGKQRTENGVAQSRIAMSELMALLENEPYITLSIDEA